MPGEPRLLPLEIKVLGYDLYVALPDGLGPMEQGEKLKVAYVLSNLFDTRDAPHGARRRG